MPGSAYVRFNPGVVIGPAEAAWEGAVEEMVTAARAGAPVRSGALRASIVYIPRTAHQGHLTSPLPYAGAQEAGSRPHLIRPSGRALYGAEEDFGPVAYAHHPGTPGRGFLRAAAEALPGFFRALMKALL